MHLEDEVCQRNKVFELMVDGNSHSRAVLHNELACTYQSFVLSTFNIHLDKGNSLALKHFIKSNSLDLLNAFEVPLLGLFLADYA